MKFFTILKSIPGYVLAVLRFVLVVVLMILTVGAYGLVVLFGFHNASRAFAMRRFFVKICLWLFGIRLSLLSPPPAGSGPRLYVCNHRSLIDPVILSRYIDAVILSKAEVRGYPLISQGAEWSGVIYVERDNRGSRTAAREALEGAFSRGFAVLVFPEGTVSVSARPLPYRRGSFEAALGCGAGVVPVALEYRDPARDFWLDGGLLRQYFKKFSKWRTEARLRFGPVWPEGGDAAAVTEAVESWTREALRDMHEGWLLGAFPEK